MRRFLKKFNISLRTRFRGDTCRSSFQHSQSKRIVSRAGSILAALSLAAFGALSISGTDFVSGAQAQAVPSTPACSGYIATVYDPNTTLTDTGYNGFTTPPSNPVGTFQYDEFANTAQHLSIRVTEWGNAVAMSDGVGDDAGFTGSVLDANDWDRAVDFTRTIQASEAGEYSVELLAGDDHVFIFKNGTQIYAQANAYGVAPTTLPNLTLASNDVLTIRLVEEHLVNTTLDLEITPLFATSCPPTADYSDAPTSGTSYGDASHTVTPGLRLGADIDIDIASLASPDADGDGTDDDGVTVPTLTAGVTADVVIAQADLTGSGTGTLHGWIDFNDNGSFEPAEYASVGFNNGATGDLVFSGYGTTAATGTTFARFRLTTDALTSVDFATLGTSDGEVEDYAVTIMPGIIALDDDFTSTPVTAGMTTEATVLTNDTLDGSLVTGTDVDILLTDLGGATGVTVTENGMLNIPSSLTPGLYSLRYQICEAGGITTCDTALVQIEVIADPNPTSDPLSCSITTDTEFTLRPNSAPIRTSGPNAWLYKNVANIEGVNYDLRVEEVGSRSRGGYSLDNQSDINMQNWNPRQGPYVILEYTLLFSTTGQPATIDRFRFTQGDIDGQNFNNSRVDDNMFEIIGFEAAEVTSINFAGGLGYRGFLNGRANPAGYRLIRQGSPSNVLNNSHDVSVEYTDKSSFRVLYGMTGRSNWTNRTSRNFFFRSFNGVFVAGSTRACPVDYTDAPASYGETGHRFTGEHQLGDLITTEAAALSSVNADADDEDDGITLPPLVKGQTATLTADVTGTGGFLQGWIDFDGSGTFEAGEQVATNLQDDGTGGDAAVGDGTITFGVNVPTDAVTTQTFARFRWATTSGLDATTGASDGEVEDYAVTIAPPLPPVAQLSCFGGTSTFSNMELSTFTPSSAFGSMRSNLNGSTISVSVTSSNSSLLVPESSSSNDFIWNSFGGAGSHDPDPFGSDGVAHNNTGSYSFAFSENVLNPHVSLFSMGSSSISVTWTFTKLDGTPIDVQQRGTPNNFTQTAPNVIQGDEGHGTIQLNGLLDGFIATAVGGPEHYSGLLPGVTCAEDYSDAPLTGTNYGSALHSINSAIMLGATIDAEFSDYNSPDASGDGADDDGVVVPTLHTGTTSDFSIAMGDITGTGTGTLHGWIDFNDNGVFEVAEHASVGFNNGATGDLVFSGYGTTAAVGTTFARFRLTSDTLGAGDFATPASDGEVEDYQVSIIDPKAGFSCTAKVDVWYANDESGSVSPTEFTDALDFIYLVSDEFYHSFADGAQGGIVGWAFGADPVDVIMPLTETFYDQGDTGLASTGTTLDGDGNGVRENYTQKVDLTGGTHLQSATQGVANRINAGNGRRTGVPQVAVILTDAPDFQINNPGNGGTTLWEAAAANLRAAGPDGTRIALVLLAEAADAYDNNAAARATIDKVVGSDGIVIKTSTYASAADPVNGFIAQTAQLICDAAVFPVSKDYSDAPTSGAAPDGVSAVTYGEATHVVDPAILLGATNDTESGSIASPNADGDGAEDDGVTIPSITQGQTVQIEADVTGAGGYLNAWIDWNGNGSFTDVGEQIVIDLQDDSGGFTNPRPTKDNDTSAGKVSVGVTAPETAFVGQTFARFRWSTDAGINHDDPATDGEVEDYVITILSRPSQPSPNPTVIAHCAAPANWANVRYSTASGENGLGGVGPLTANVTTSGTSSVNIGSYSWAGSNRVNVFLGSEFTIQNTGMEAGAIFYDAGIHTLDQTMTQTFEGANVYEVRMHFASFDHVTFGFDPALNPNVGWELLSKSDDTGNLAGGSGFVFADVIDTDKDTNGADEILQGDAGKSADGSVRFYSTDGNPITQLIWKMESDPIRDLEGEGLYLGTEVCIPVDRSDADTSFGEAEHSYDPVLRLGATNDIDPVSIASANASGDGAEDDGVALPASFEVGVASTVSVSVSGLGHLQAWIDWNGNGIFDSIEQIATDLVDGGALDTDPASGTITFDVMPPTDAMTGQTFARFRWSSDFSIGVDDFAPDGEVEDYALTIGATGTVLSGKVFVDNGIGGATAHDAVQSGTEAPSPAATVMLMDSGGNVIAMPMLNGDGTWSYALPSTFTGPVTVTATPTSGYRTISELTTGLPGLANVDGHDGSYTFTPSSGTSYPALDIGMIAEPVLTQDRQASINPGQVVTLEHLYVATTDASVTFTVTDLVSTPAGGFSTTLFEDTNCDGNPDTAISGARAVIAGQSICLIARTQLSGGLSPSASHTYGIEAVTSYSGTTVMDTLRNDDTIGSGDGNGNLVLRKLVTNLSVTPQVETTSNTGNIGDVLRYRLEISNPGPGNVEDVTVSDMTPAYTSLNTAADTAVTVANGVTCTLVTPPASSNMAGYTGPLEWFCPGSFPSGETGSLNFQVTISP